MDWTDIAKGNGKWWTVGKKCVWGYGLNW